MVDITQFNALSTGAVSSITGVSSTPVLGSSATEAAAKVAKYQQGITSVDNLYFPEDLPKYHFRMEYSQYNAGTFRSNLNQVTFKKLGTISLPLPISGLLDNHEIDYTEEQLGLIGAGLTAGVGAVSSLLGNKAASPLSPPSPAETAASAALGASSTAQAVTGYTPNKFLTILLRGPRYKRHDFVWKLVPKNKNETTRIKNIIQTLNNKMSVGVLSSSNVLWKFPKIWWFTYMPNFNLLYKFKPCVIESASYNYMPSGTPSFYQGDNGDNPPESVEIRIRAIELEFWLEDQFKDTSTGTNFNQVYTPTP